MSLTVDLQSMNICISCGIGPRPDDSLNHVGARSNQPIEILIEQLCKLGLDELAARIKTMKKEKKKYLFMYHVD